VIGSVIVHKKSLLFVFLDYIIAVKPGQRVGGAALVNFLKTGFLIFTLYEQNKVLYNVHQ
jgi:hypothetical protein